VYFNKVLDNVSELKEKKRYNMKSWVDMNALCYILTTVTAHDGFGSTFKFYLK